MATFLENLIARRDAIGSELAAMSLTKPGGKPTYSADGQSVQHTEYRLSLLDELEKIEQRINSAQGPIEIETIGQV